MPDGSSTPDTNNGKLTRRDFLKMAAVAAPSVALGAKLLPSLGSETLKKLGPEAVSQTGIFSEVLTRGANYFLQKFLNENPQVKQNDNVSKFSNIIQTACSEYTKITGVKPTFSRQTGYQTENQSKELLRVILTNQRIYQPDPDSEETMFFLGIRPDLAMELLVNQMSSNARDVFFFADERMNASLMQVIYRLPTSGMATRAFAEAKTTDEMRKKDPNNETVNNKLETSLEKQILEMRDFVERQFSQTGKQVPPQEVLRKYLEINNGSLDKSLWDMAIFFKVMTRNYEDGNISFSENGMEGEWIEKYIRSDLCPIDLNTLPEDSTNPETSKRNIRGYLYHACCIAASVDSFFCGFMQFGTTARTLKISHGNIKTASDWAISANLQQIETMASEYLQT